MTQAVAAFSDATLRFLASLATNNNKTWFDAHRSACEQHLLAPARAFVEDMGEALRELAPDVHAEPRVNGSIFRINRDTRFSKDKRPYKDHLALWFWQGRRRSRECSGYYLGLRPDALTLGTGMHRFFPELLVSYRDAVVDPIRGAALAAAVQTASDSGAEIGGRPKSDPRSMPHLPLIATSHATPDRDEPASAAPHPERLIILPRTTGGVQPTPQSCWEKIGQPECDRAVMR